MEGVGAGIAIRLAQAGASVTILGRNSSRADEMLKRLKSAYDLEAGKHLDRPAPDFDFLQSDLR